VDYGAFAAFDVEVTDTDGRPHVVEVSGLIHRNELSWSEVRLVEDIVQASPFPSSSNFKSTLEPPLCASCCTPCVWLGLHVCQHGGSHALAGALLRKPKP
jgi:hypothetical protein